MEPVWTEPFFMELDLEGAILNSARLEGAGLQGANLYGSQST